MIGFRLLFCFLLMTIAIGCSDDFFVSDKEVIIPDESSELVVIANLNLSEECSEIILSRTKNILDTSPFEILRDANVSIATGATEYKFSISESDSTYANCDKVIQSEDIYTLRVETQEETIQAITNVPELVEVTDVNLDLSTYVVDVIEFIDIVTFKIEDPPGENFYSLQISYFEEIGDGIFSEAQYTIVNPESITSSFNLFTDEEFENTEKIFTLLLNRCCFIERTDNLKKVRIKLSNLSKEAYLYEQSIIEYNSAKANPFIDPGNIFSNIEGGRGIFSISNDFIYDIEL